jgi:hypothetical protein
MKAICSSEMSVDFQRTARCYIPEDSTLHCFVLAGQVYSTVVNTMTYLGSIALYATLVAIACSQLQKLQAGLKNFRRGSLMNPDTEHEEFHEYVRLHQDVLRLVLFDCILRPYPTYFVLVPNYWKVKSISPTPTNVHSESDDLNIMYSFIHFRRLSYLETSQAVP